MGIGYITSHWSYSQWLKYKTAKPPHGTLFSSVETGAIDFKL